MNESFDSHLNKWYSIIIGVFCFTSMNAQTIPMPETFGSMGKEQVVLKEDCETELFSREGEGVITHLWFGGDFRGYEQTHIRIYVDHEEQPSIDMELFMGHGIGFNDSHAPWTTTKIGKTGNPSSVYNTFKIPFGSHVRICAQLAPGAAESTFWWIVRGSTQIPVEIAGLELPKKARLCLHKIENKVFQPLEEFDLCNVNTSGAVYMVAMAGKGLRTSTKDRWKDLSYQEACVRAYIGGRKEPLMISSGLEDYFLGTYYFNSGRYYSDLAGLTHFDPEKNEFSAYRFHTDDPIFFKNGLRLTNRIGEKINNYIYHDPPTTQYTTYVWLYEW